MKARIAGDMTSPSDPNFSREQWEKLVQETVDRVLFLGRRKGAEYAGPEDDFLGNIRSQAVDLGTNMELIWGVLAGKQWNAVRTYISDMVKGVQRERSEPIEGRVDDLITYLLLFKAIVREKEEARPKAVLEPNRHTPFMPPDMLPDMLSKQFRRSDDDGGMIPF